MVYTGTFTFYFVLEEWLQYLRGPNSVAQKCHGTVCDPTLLCPVKMQNVII
jgi:hypothetical protein